jgi:hypothetical protein
MFSPFRGHCPDGAPDRIPAFARNRSHQSGDLEFRFNYDDRMPMRHTNRKTKRKMIGAAGSDRKERVTVTLSRHSAEYVRSISAQERSHVSTVMERMIEAARRSQELKQLNAEISAFYDARPDSVVQDHAAWGQVGAAGLAALVESEADEILADRAPRDSAR